MKHTDRSAALAAAALLAFAVSAQATDTAGGTSIEDVSKEAAELVETLEGYGADRRDAAMERANGALRDIDQRIAALQTRIDEELDEADAAARERAQQSLQALREQRAVVADWYERMKGGSADAWDSLKQGFSDAYGDMRDAWQATEREVGATQ